MASRRARLVPLGLHGEGERPHPVLFQGAVTKGAARGLLVHEHGPLAVRAIPFSHRGLFGFVRHRHRARGERSPACIGGISPTLNQADASPATAVPEPRTESDPPLSRRVAWGGGAM